MGSYYRRFIQNYSSVVRPLIELTKKNKSFDWTPECQTAFNTLMSAFTSTGIMGFPRDKGEFYLDTDASDYQIGAVLSQMQDGLRFCHPFIFMLSIDLPKAYKCRLHVEMQQS